eukprot:CAMPEP_0172709104 /NCGR_PEP_ID=MMETSP1074-20121228/53387_1 /TAXON_ID=2916 /ORGANISM="Ceratium fusus, Strain PA161109" /LENGTH=183 /DNA_ID=CAMNT_0013532245 /DNA_START=71 /DNA_END=622 /DNA_ORIENTATION=+
MAKDLELPPVDEKKVGSLYSKTDLMKVMSEYFNDALPRAGYVEDHFWINIRIMLCVACCGFGMYAQFGTKFPKDRHMLALCVAGYFIFSGVLALLDYWVISMSVMCIKVGEDSVFVDVNLPAFSHEVTLSLRSRAKKVSQKDSIGKYFDTEGILRPANVFSDFTELLRKYELKDSGKENKKNQ